MRSLNEKTSTDDIRKRFDGLVERFSNLDTGQKTLIDAPLMLDLVAETAAGAIKPGGDILDIGCGAGNQTLTVLARVSPLNCTLVDLSGPMLARAKERVSAATSGKVETIQSDMRELKFAAGTFDVIVCGAVLHHLREDLDWVAMFGRLFEWLKPGGMLLVSDMVSFDEPHVQAVMQKRYAEYLEGVGGKEFRETVFGYIDEEDSPRSLQYQLELLRRTGFSAWDVLHRNSVFASYFGKK